MDLDTFRRLLTPEGRAALAAATALRPTDATFLPCHDRLRKHVPPDLAKAAVETALLRAKAAAKFAHAGGMYFTREALEQASGEVIAGHRAGRFAAFGEVADLGCGIGGDTLGLAAAGRTVHAVDSDPLRAAMAEANAAACGVGGRVRVRVADVLTDPLPAAAAAFADPGRRADGKRFLALDRYLPPPAAVLARLPGHFPIGFKLAPGVSWDDLDRHPDAEAEFLSVNGELKECVLWFGPLATARRRATVLPTGATLAAAGPAPPREVVPPGAYLYDPDPAVVRSGLVHDLAERLDAAPADATVALLTADELRPTPFATAYRVDAVVPPRDKAVRESLRSRGAGRVTPVKLGLAVDADAVLKKWKPAGDRHLFVLLTRLGGKPAVVLADRVGDAPVGG